MTRGLRLLLLFFGAVSCREFIIVRHKRNSSSEQVTDEKVESEERPRREGPEVTQLQVQSSISYRYAHTRVTSRLVNRANSSQEAVFSLLLPATAFITSFLMEVEGKQYKAFLREKELAKKEYEEAVAGGLSAGHVHHNARNSNRFAISVNVEPSSKVLFVLTYEELLVRTLGLYSHVISLDPHQDTVKDLLVDVFISEPTDIVNLQVPRIQATPELSNQTLPVNELVEIKQPNTKKAHIRYRPSIEEQKKNPGGGQLIVKYDVDRKEQPGGQILVNDGYFIHFFAPEGLPPLRKLAIFVLDLSGSMEGRKVEQLKTAMNTILDDLGKRDHFNIIDFSYSVTIHNLETPAGSVVLPPDTAVSRSSEIPPPYPTTPEYIAKAKQVIAKMSSGGGTNIYDALKNAILVAQSGVEKIKKDEGGKAEEEDKLEPIIIFLTDGDPTVGITKLTRILSMVKEYNNPRYSIFSLGFGNGADMRFLRKLSLNNAGFARSIYEAADAALQLSNFYKEVASPLLTNVTFSYVPGQVVIDSLTKGSFPSLFLGSELVVAGKLAASSDVTAKVQGSTVNGTTSFDAHALRNVPDDISTIEYIEDDKTTQELTEELEEGNAKSKKKKIVTNIERVWAYLTIQQMAEQVEALDGSPQAERELRNKATALALKYKFVTPFTSLVVVKPNKTVEVSNDNMQTSGNEQHVFKTKLSYLQGALYGFPSRFPASSPDMMSPLPGHSSSSIDRFDAGDGGEETGYMSSSTEDETSGSMGSGENSSGGSSSSASSEDSRLYLEDITWLPEVYHWENSSVALPSPGPVNVTQYYLFLNSTSDEELEGVTENCTLRDGVEGVCRHVTDCILSQFAFSLQEYVHNYFCLVKGKYAGACCPELMDPSSSYYYPYTEENMSYESSEVPSMSSEGPSASSEGPPMSGESQDASQTGPQVSVLGNDAKPASESSAKTSEPSSVNSDIAKSLPPSLPTVAPSHSSSSLLPQTTLSTNKTD